MLNENLMEIKCYGICSENCMAWKDGQCAIHATCIDEVEELFKAVDDYELFELVRKNYSEVNKEYIQEQIKIASEHLTDKQKKTLSN